MTTNGKHWKRSKPLSAEQKLTISAATKGKPHFAARGKPSGFTGKHHSEKSKAQSSATHKLPEVMDKILISVSKISTHEVQLVEALTRINLKPTQQFFVKLHYCFHACTFIDLAFPDARLAVYCDGERHYNVERVKQRDNKINVALEAKGWTVLRFNNKQIENDIYTCVDAIRAVLNELLIVD